MISQIDIVSINKLSLIDWLVFNANLSNISAISWHRNCLWYWQYNIKHIMTLPTKTITLVLKVSSCRQGVLDTTLCDIVCQWLVAGMWFSPGTLVSSTNTTDRHDITEILFKVALNTITLTLTHFCILSLIFTKGSSYWFFPSYCGWEYFWYDVHSLFKIKSSKLTLNSNRSIN